MFGFGRKRAGAISARGEITSVDFGRQNVDGDGNTVAARFTVGVRVFPDNAASFDAVVSVMLSPPVP